MKSTYFGEAKATELVIDNPLKISEQIEVIKPIPDGTFTPEIEGANDELVSITHEKAESMYGSLCRSRWSSAWNVS